MDCNKPIAGPKTLSGDAKDGLSRAEHAFSNGLGWIRSDKRNSGPRYGSLGLLLIGTAFIVLAAGCGNKSAATPDTFKIGVIPYEQPTKIKQQYKLFGDYLGSKVGRTGEIYVSSDYLGIGQALMSGQIDCAYLNPLSYVLFADHMQTTPQKLTPIAMPYVHGSLYYTGSIFTSTTSGITTIAQLKGKRMAFVEPTSTSGYIYPFDYLTKHGIDPKKDFAATFNAGASGVVPSVLNGSADAGAVFSEALTNPKLLSTTDMRQIRVLATVGPIANGMFVVRGDLDPKTIAAIKAAMRTINTDPAGMAANKAMSVDKWAVADDSVFDPVRKTASVVGLNLQALAKK